MFTLSVNKYQVGDHTCCLFENEEERRSLVTPYIKQGLGNGERVIYLVDGPTAAPLLAYLRADGVDVNGFLNSGQLSVVRAVEVCAPLGVLDPLNMLAWMAKEEAKAKITGFAALRMASEMTWALRGVADADRVVDFEWKLNAYFPGHCCIGLCQYDRRRFDESTLGDIVTTHPMVLCGARGYKDLFVHAPAKGTAFEEPKHYDPAAPQSDPNLPKIKL